MPDFKVNIKGAQRNIKKFKQRYGIQMRAAYRDIGKTITASSLDRFRSAHTGAPANLVKAVKEAGWELRTSKDRDTTVLIGDMNKLDRLTAKTAIATGITHHLWRIFHEGSGPKGAGTQNNPSIHGGRLRNQPYPFYVYVRTNDFLPLFGRGTHPPFKELVSIAQVSNSVNVIYSRGKEGRSWYLKNSKLFKNDEAFIRQRIRKAIKRTVKDRTEEATKAASLSAF